MAVLFREVSLHIRQKALLPPEELCVDNRQVTNVRRQNTAMGECRTFCDVLLALWCLQMAFVVCGSSLLQT